MNKWIILAGSTDERDQKIILNAFRSLNNHQMGLILVPHEIHERKIKKLIDSYPAEMIQYSKINPEETNCRILIFDSVGELKHLYRYAAAAIVGGGFSPMGIHNIIEPATYEIPVAFGPNHRNYPESIALLKMHAATVFNNELELTEFLRQQFEKSLNSTIREKMRKYILENSGAVEKTISALPNLNPSPVN